MGISWKRTRHGSPAAGHKVRNPDEKYQEPEERTGPAESAARSDRSALGFLNLPALTLRRFVVVSLPIGIPVFSECSQPQK